MVIHPLSNLGDSGHEGPGFREVVEDELSVEAVHGFDPISRRHTSIVAGRVE